MSDSIRNRIRSHIHKSKGKKEKKGLGGEEEFFDLGDSISVSSNVSGDGNSGSVIQGFIYGDDTKERSSSFDRAVFEEQLNLLQEQLVSVMIENQNLSHQLDEYKAADKGRSLPELKDRHFRKKPADESFKGPKKRGDLFDEPNNTKSDEILTVESKTKDKKTRIDSFMERMIERFYDVVEDFTEITKLEQPKSNPEPQLTVKILKENIKRFTYFVTEEKKLFIVRMGENAYNKRSECRKYSLNKAVLATFGLPSVTALKPYTDTLKGLRNAITWYSPSFTVIVFCIYMYTVWRGWLIPFLIFLAVVRIAVNYLHFKNFNFRFSYFDPGVSDKETDDATLGLSDKFNLVLQVATKVQNGLGTAADSLEKFKNLFTWRQYEATRRVFTGLCFMLITSIVLPTSYFWTLIGLGLGVKIFLVNPIYARYPRIKRRYDTSSKLWAALPTDAQYNKDFVTEEMNKYIVIPTSASEQEVLFQQSSSESDDDDDESMKSVEFRELFSLPPAECPLTGWMRGRRALLVGRDKSVFNLISKKRGKLFLTNSFLCFVREKVPSPRNIVIPLQDIINVERVKVSQRLPGKGMAIRITMSSDGNNSVLIFGGIISRDESASAIERAIDNVNKYVQKDVSSRRSWSSESSASRISNFTFGPYYEDSDSMSE